MDEVAELIRECEVPLTAFVWPPNHLQSAWRRSIGQMRVVFHAKSHTLTEPKQSNCLPIKTTLSTLEKWKLWAHAEHCEIAVCKHPTRPIRLFNFILKQ